MLVDALYARVKQLGVECRFGERVTELPGGAVIIAVEPADARALLDDDSLRVSSGHTVCIDLALTSRHGDPFIVSDLDECRLGRALHGRRPVARARRRGARAGADADPPRRDRRRGRRRGSSRCSTSRCPTVPPATVWHRRLVMDGRTGALDLPGTTWRDRPAVDRGDGVLLAGDWAAAPGLLSEVAWASAIAASERAVELAGAVRAPLRRVA